MGSGWNPKSGKTWIWSTKEQALEVKPSDSFGKENHASINAQLDAR